ncbi:MULTISPECIES: PQQ-dependent sugar dehydrogenase [unclassified Methylophaga]|uniref:PQQ-dependent sugar dehydrogenase n=2 Tax=Methylophaga TaxID=40222 RepID=UPI000C909BFC|nr:MULTISPECIES: sorbosone dehydrogenase family protein [unclassified Methylophaga]MBN47831.1 sorbosone dehydrogenase [Methylophaga sp.]|tara:strand:+ start:66694 stop:68016 length:1323 start_codon:yes stop_codon:yes gene_type:complete
MQHPSIVGAFIGVLAVSLTGCGDRAKIPPQADYGPEPTLVAPKQALIPTVKIAPAKGWPIDGEPIAAEGLQVNRFAMDLDHPRWLYVLPNGDVLVAESNAPESEKPNAGIKDWIKGLVMKRAGAAVPSADRITLLRDEDGDGVAETRHVFLEDLHSPFGMALIGNDFYVANADAIVSFPYEEGQTQITAEPQHIADLPGGPINHHWTKNIIANDEGTLLYATVGSNSNIGENGMENEENRAAILEVNPDTGEKRLFASGLRNPNGLAWQPQSGELWTTVNERDEIGSDLVPDYMTSVQDGGFYGWPYSYYGQTVDTRVEPPRPDLVEKAIKPDYALGAHTASLGLAFYKADLLGAQYQNGAFVGQHGSWNRKPLSGYKVIFVPFKEGEPDGMPQDILTGFVDGNGDAMGRPVGVVVDKQGGILVADDVGNIVWRVSPKAD